MNGTVAAAAVAATLALAAIAWAVTRRRVRRIASPEEVAEAVNGALRGFRTLDAVVGADGTGALAISGDGRIAAVRRRGSRLAVHEVSWRAVRAAEGGMVIEADGRFGPVMLTGVDVLDIRRLAPSAKRAPEPAAVQAKVVPSPPAPDGDAGEPAGDRDVVLPAR